MDTLSHPLTNEELRSLWLVLTIEDLSRLIQSIREQDMFRTDISALEPAFVLYIMQSYLRPSVKLKDAYLLLWPEFCSNFNSYWTRRLDIYENWKANNSFGLPQPTALVNPISRDSPSYPPVRLINTVTPQSAGGRSLPSNAKSGVDADIGSVRVLEAELVEVSEKLRQTRYQLEEEKQKRHTLRDELDNAKQKAEDERMRYLEATKQLVALEEDKLTHEVQVSRIREQLEQNISLKETLQLDLDRVRMQLNHAKEKYETALSSAIADNESLRKKVDVLSLELADQSSATKKKDVIELESQNAVLRQIVERYRKSFPTSRFADAADAASSAAFDSNKLGSASDFLNTLMEALDKAKFLNKQMVTANDSTNTQTWKDLCLGWRESVCELCDLFSMAHRMESNSSVTYPSSNVAALGPVNANVTSNLVVPKTIEQK